MGAILASIMQVNQILNTAVCTPGLQHLRVSFKLPKGPGQVSYSGVLLTFLLSNVNE